MILTSFDPGKITSYAVFDTTRPWQVEIGEIDLIGFGRFVRPCGDHIARVVAASDQVVCEEVGAMKGQGVSSMFTFGMCLGAILGSIQATGKPLEWARPSSWRSASRLGGLKDAEAKEASRLYAIELWPEHRERLRAKSSHGMAEAALMARWYFMMGPGRDIEIDQNCPMKSAKPKVSDAKNVTPLRRKAARAT